VLDHTLTLDVEVVRSTPQVMVYPMKPPFTSLWAQVVLAANPPMLVKSLMGEVQASPLNPLRLTALMKDKEHTNKATKRRVRDMVEREEEEEEEYETW